ncbi:hypothetical protein BKA83DRAFT_3166760 [Pisolithus microcarpus]|nr:hypothetical protein BKA83DRAFT_3166760 [Pisolithus microcarpus]
MMEPSILGREIGTRVSHILASLLALVLKSCLDRMLALRCAHAVSSAELNVRSAFLVSHYAMNTYRVHVICHWGRSHSHRIGSCVGDYCELQSMNTCQRASLSPTLIV